MRIPTMIFAAALAAATCISPAAAARICHCSSEVLTPGGHCTEFNNCEDVLEFAPTPATFKPLRSAKACGRSQAVVCDFNSCKLVCSPQSQ